MNTIIKVIVTILLSTLLGNAQEKEGHKIEVSIKDIESKEGKIYVALYDNENGFLSKALVSKSSAINDKLECSVTFDALPDGEYAVSVYHDENNNGKLDSNFLGIPKEDYGCSNNAKGFMGPPKWKDAKFELKQDDHKLIITL